MKTNKQINVIMPIEEYEAIKQMAEKVDDLERKADELKAIQKKVTITMNTLDQIQHNCDKQLYGKYNAKWDILKVLDQWKDGVNDDRLLQREIR